jgi:tetratricopeptide (TPR) repeat protein
MAFRICARVPENTRPARRGIVLLLGLALAAGCTQGIRPGAALHYSDADLSGGVSDRSAHGNNLLPIWSPLTVPEQRALQDRDKAAAGDPGALLSLAIFASGDKRTPEEYAAIHASVAAFVAKMRPELAAEKSPWQKGFKLHRAMHAAFFPPTSEGEATPQGYDWAQSKLTGIFAADRKYNCISSALLFLVLAREFGFQAKGVILPTHAFAQLTLPDGKIIEVETTSPSGYDWIHDETFYKKRALAWFSARGLPASTYGDYLARRIVEPSQLAAYNMSNQHTASNRMSGADRCRLVEGRAWADPGDLDAQMNRIGLYASEYKVLSANGDWKTLERMYRLVAPTLPGLRRTWDRETEFSNHIAWQPYCYATTLHGLGRDAEALPWIDSSLAWLRPEAKEGKPLKGNNAALLMLITRGLAERKDYATAERYLLRYPALLREDENFQSQLAWVYQEEAMQAWERKDWQSAADIFAKALASAPKSFRKPIQENLATAYLNMAAARQNEGDWPKARAALRTCLEKVPDASKCRSWMEELVAQHNLDD